MRFNVLYEGVTLPVAVDYRDFTFVQEQCLSEVGLYFKMQYLRSGYNNTSVVPGGYIANKRVYDHYCRLRTLRSRETEYDVYGRFGLGAAREIRTRAMDMLGSQDDFRFTGGTSPVLHFRSLIESAQAGVCIDLPGNGPFCYRLVDYLAMGCCVVGPRHATTMHAELRDGEHIIYCRDDLSDLVDVCARYVDDDSARRTIATNAARFFDEHLHPVRLATYYLQRCKDQFEV